MPTSLTKVAQTEEMAVLAVALVIVLRFEMTDAPKTVVVDVNCLMVDMNR